MAFEFDGTIINGRSSIDHLFGIADGPNHQIFGGGRTDFIVGDFGNLFFNASGNGSLETAAARDLDRVWSTDTVTFIQDSAVVPHTTMLVRGERTPAQEFFSVTVGAGETLFADTDFSTFDTVLSLFNADGDLLVTNNNSSGDAGSELSAGDSFLSYVNETGAEQILFVRLGRFEIGAAQSSGNLASPDDITFLHLSVSGHVAEDRSLRIGDDLIEGGSGDDLAFGGGGNDALFGESGDDVLYGDAGDDFLMGGSGSDRLTGGDGIDLASYADRVEAVIADLDAGTATSGADTDTLSEIENLRGTLFNDTLRGDGAANQLLGNDGSDILIGRAGDDVLAGDRIRDMDGIEGQVYRIYRAVFDRSPDIGGFKLFTSEIRAGRLTELQVVAEFVASQEFSLTYGDLTNAEFVQTIFRNVLPDNRDAAGQAAFESALNAGTLTRTDMVLELSQSAEFIARTELDNAAFAVNVVTHPAEGEIYRIYQAVFDRVPDPGGFANFVNVRQLDTLSVEEITAEFVESAEFVATYGDLDDAAFVETLYANVLPGNTDAVGRTNFIEALGNGSLTRAQMVAEFAQSAELRARTEDAVALFVQDIYSAAADTLSGGSGADILFGGRGADRFEFDIDDGGAARILDFTVGVDVIALSGSGFDSLDDLLAVSRSEGADIVFDFGNGQSLTLVNVTADSLTEESVLFDAMIL